MCKKPKERKFHKVILKTNYCPVCGEKKRENAKKGNV
jgi:hypothetical protein